MAKSVKKTPAAPNVQISKSSFIDKFIENKWAIPLVLIATVFISYIFGFNNQFLDWDDNSYVFKNNDLLQLKWSNLLQTMYAGNYHPLTMLSLGLNALFLGKSAASFIFVNVFLHAVNTLLVYVFIKKISRNEILLSLFVALIWGVHPMHVESVIWISERKDVLYGFFFLLSCIYYINYRQQNSTKKYWLAFVFFILSCLSKGMAVTLPLVLLLIDYWFEKKILIKNKIIFFIGSLFFGLLAINIQGGGNFYGLIRVTKEFTAIGNSWTLLQKFVIAGYGIAVYLAKCIVPINLHNFYPYPYASEIFSSKYVIPAFFSLLVLVGWLISYTKNRLFFFGFGFFMASIIIVLQLISVGSAIVSERYTYLPYIGLIFLLVKTFDFFKNRHLLAKIGIILVVLFMVLTMKYTQHWKNTKIMWENAYQYEPESPLIASYLAGQYGFEDNSEKVYEICKKFAELNVNEPRIYELYGNSLAKKNELDKAIEQYNKAINYSIQRNNIPITLISIYNNMAKVYISKKEYINAINTYQKVLKIDTSAIEPLAEIATAKLLLGKQNEAIDDFTTVIQQLSLEKTKDTVAAQKLYKYFENRGVVYSQVKNYANALLDFDKSIAINPTNSSAFYNRGITKDLMKKSKTEVIADFSEAIKRNDQYSEAYYDRGIIYWEEGNLEQACKDFNQALILKHPLAQQVINQYCK